MRVNEIFNQSMSTYEYIDAIWPKNRRGEKDVTIANNTRLVANDDGSFSVWLHATEIVRAYNSGHCFKTVLRTGGYHTGTTKQRINAFLPTTAKIGQRDHVWYLIHFRPTTGKIFDGQEFQEGMNLYFDYWGRFQRWDVELSAQSAIMANQMALSFVLGSDQEPTAGNLADWLLEPGTSHALDFSYLAHTHVAVAASYIAQEMVAAGMRGNAS